LGDQFFGRPDFFLFFLGGTRPHALIKNLGGTRPHALLYLELKKNKFNA